MSEGDVGRGRGNSWIAATEIAAKKKPTGAGFLLIERERKDRLRSKSTVALGTRACESNFNQLIATDIF